MKWNVLKDMQALYECGKIKRKPSFVDDPDVDHLINSTKELCVLLVVFTTDYYSIFYR